MGLASALGIVRLVGLSELGLGLRLVGLVSELVVDGLAGVRLVVSGLGERLVVVGLVALSNVLLVVDVEDGLNEDVPSDEVPSDEVGAGASNGEEAGLVVRIVLIEDMLERRLPPRLLPPMLALDELSV